MTRMRILLCFARAVIPNQAIPFGAERGRFADGVLVHDLAVVISFVVDVSPLDLAAREQLPEGFVLSSGSGEDSKKSTLVLMDIGHVFRGGQFAVRHVEEVGASDQATKQVS